MRLEELLRAATLIRDEAVERHPGLTGARPPATAAIAAIGLATVDADRAVAEGPPDPWLPLPRDPLLGATVRRLASASPSTEPDVLLLEPDTEGPLAAALARFGEGLAAVYLRPARLFAVPGRSAADGPLGPAQLLPGPRWGPHVVILDPAATIDP